MNEPFNGAFLVKEIDSAIGTDAIIIGVPYEDKSPIYLEGAAKAPEEVRRVSHFFSGQSLNSESIHTRNVLDYGNITTKSQYSKLVTELGEKVAKIIEIEAKPIIIGGDHSIALGTATGLKKSQKKFDAILWIDAHLDLMDKYPQEEEFTRATVLRRILELELVNPKNIYMIGCRGHNIGVEEIELIEKLGINTFTANDFQNQQKRSEFIMKIKEKHDSLYVSLDMDVLDPAFAPGVSVPEPGGINTRELFYLIKKLAKKISCLEIVEGNPQLDNNGITMYTICRVVFEYLDYMQ